VGEIKRIVSPVQEMLDHHLLSEIPGLEENTDEALPHWLYNKLKVVLPSLVRMELEATPGAAALVCEADPAAILPADYTIR
ncbi:MAG: 6-carboxytetrahydropterin synthase, partial [Candidatus Porifericomitaceae bacterium WSBS_2022_MAG_OTU9]